ncbi:MAG: hypothetical protein DCC65_00315 [Planctomycetota bacterium]|nr:MAG: hypothetical protein DCC65_00315 [Planctomycetota bacterium]
MLRRRSTFCISVTTLLGVLLAGCGGEAADASAVERVFGGPGLSPGEFSYPRAIAVSPVDGSVFVCDKTARIQRFSPAGEYEHQWRMPEFKNGKPTGMAVDSNNRLWVADTHYYRVIAFDRDGRELLRFGSRGEGPGQFGFPCSVAIDRNGFVYVGEYGGNDRISKFTPDGRFIASFADKGAGEGWVERPASLVFDPDGTLWVADACHHRICRYGTDGRFLIAFGTAGDGPGELNYPYGVAIEGTGTLLVADRGNSRITRFTRDGAFVASWGSPGRAVGQIAQPWGVALDREGGIYCLDSWNNRVQLIHW